MRLGTIAAVAIIAAVATACGPKPSADEAAAAATPPAPQLNEAEKAALLASYPAPYAQANLANGEAKFGLCRSCHTITPGGSNMTGPNLHGVFGRKAASVAGYKYSEALKAAGWSWDAARLDQWLAEPRTFLPGTKMAFAGVKNPDDRRDIVAYLMVETGHKVEAVSPGQP
jgi:cytochrome c